jgi:ADP-ribose pyrophosphatase YjhB (NUDIX family)
LALSGTPILAYSKGFVGPCPKQALIAMSRAYPLQPLVGVGVIVLRGDDVLMIQRGKEPGLGRWSIPGGCQEIGETVFEAAVRETREETALDVRSLAIVDVVDSIRRDASGIVQYHYTLIEVLAVPLTAASVPEAGGDALEALWMPCDGLASLGLWDETVRVIEKARTMHGKMTAAADWRIALAAAPRTEIGS